MLVARNFRRDLLITAALSIAELVAVTVQPFLIQDLIQQRKPSTVVVAGLVGLVQGLGSAHALLLLRKIGMRVRSGLTALVCDRGLEHASIASGAADPSILIEVDLSSVFMLVESMNSFWVLPLQIVVSLAAVMYILGWLSVLIGCGCVLLIVPLLLFALHFLARGMGRVLAAKDARLSLIKHTLARIKHIKLFGWQKIFEEKIDAARGDEMKAVSRVAYPSITIVVLTNVLPVILVSVSFGTHLALGGSLPSAVVFPCLILFNTVTRASSSLPRTLLMYQGASISYQRVRNFILTSPTNGEGCGDYESRIDDEAIDVSLEEAAFDAPGDYNDTERPLLKKCTLQASPGCLTVIRGSVGAGKTTLVRAILGEIRPKKGSVHVSGRIAYAPQKPFLINGSIRENILFGLPLDASWYGRVVKATCLDADFASLADGDGTSLEGTGTTLSGGQQSRVALARAIYSRRPLVVLDDPLVAVDATVQRRLVENVLGPNGILKDCTRIVTTSSKALIELADAVYTISDGALTLAGLKLLEEVTTTSSEARDIPRSTLDFDVPGTPLEPSDPSWTSSRSTLSESIPLTLATGTQRTDADLEMAPLLATPLPSTAGLLDLGVGSVKMGTYLSYLKSGKRWGWPLVMVTAVVCILFNIGAIGALQAAAEDFDTIGHSSKLGLYAISGTLGALLTIPFVLSATFLCVIPASRAIHARLVSGLVHSKFSFFDTTPLGHILNRFTNDMNRVDTSVNSGFLVLVMIGLIIVFSLLAVIFSSPASMLYLIPVMFIYRFLQSYYMHACRQLRRLDNNARNPILNVAGEMRSGFAVILAYEQGDFFRQRARDLIDEHVRVWMPFLCLDVWLQLRLYGLACAVGVLTASLLLIVDAPSSTLGFVMNFVLQVTGLLGAVVQILANLEADLISLERIYRYAHNTPEEDYSDENQLPTTWPADPTITIENYNASYRPGGTLCLRKINVSIEAGERIAIVGRTGAGKSSLVLALMRALDAGAVRPGSRISIDGRDILSEVSIPELRKRITIIPQEPVVFSGTMRENLDPLGVKAESDLQDAVAMCNLAKALGIEEDDDPLEYRIAEWGSNLSTGQAQLLAIARAIAENRRIVIIDEATASVDHATVTLINDVMKRAFEGSTVLTIAHHIASVIDYDRILVLDQGSVVEFDKPQNLLGNPDSIFSQLAGEASSKS
ncbi:P-loop containing nucleoside triphosphate hydrolase protein [Thozetella sp. PMI_491]|nr:P-loop containing nucleoside triphosphate hydrolase protein [Thozetella sp. PMI_491]